MANGLGSEKSQQSSLFSPSRGLCGASLERPRRLRGLEREEGVESAGGPPSLPVSSLFRHSLNLRQLRGRPAGTGATVSRLPGGQADCLRTGSPQGLYDPFPVWSRRLSPTLTDASSPQEAGPEGL